MISDFAASAETHVNTTTAEEQQHPQVVVLESGNYVVAWKDHFGAPGNTRHIRGQLYAADGTPIGGEFQLDATDTAPNSNFSLAALPGGGFIAVWSGEDGNGTDDDQLRAQFFNADMSKAGAEFTVNTISQSLQEQPAVEVLANGNIIITWTNWSGIQGIGPDPIHTSVMGRIVSPTGTPIGSEFLVNFFPQGSQTSPAVTALAGGGFVAVWTDTSRRYGGDIDSAVVGQIFSDSGAKIGAPFLVNTVTANDQHTPSVAALPNGGFVVAWTDQNGVFNGSTIRAQILDSVGAKVGGEILIDGAPGGQTARTLVTTLAGGGFLIAWNGFGAPVEAQLFEDDGTKVGGEFVLRDNSGTPWVPAIAALADGGFVLAYGADLDPMIDQFGSERGIGAIRFAAVRDGVSIVGTDAGEPIGGGGFADYLDGQGGDDTIVGGDGHDILHGRLGNDSLEGGAGDDRLFGGFGDDLYVGVDAGDVIVEVGGVDEVETGLAAYALAAGVENLTGTSAAGQALTGNGLANRIVGGAGADHIEGGLGDDSLDGGTGADELVGGPGHDNYAVDSGDLVVEAAGAGTDIVSTALAAYTLTDNVENLTGLSAAGQALTGNGLANRIVGAAGGDTIDGGDGADTLEGGGGSDGLSGGPGNDLLHYVADASGADVDVIDGGSGTDTLYVSFPNPAEVVGLTWSLTANPLGGYDGWIANGAGDRVEFTQIERFRISGTAAAETMSGGALDDLLLGLGGDDALDGGAGDDLLDGGEGADQMTGGAGNDSYFVDAAGDQVVELANGGTDSITTSLAVYALGGDVEWLFGALATGQQLTGNGLANIVGGGAGNDRLDGGAGADLLLGYEGDDIYWLDNVGDSIGELSGTDEVRTTLAALDLSSASFIENITGLVDSGQTLIANFGNNIIRGGGGNDLLDGRTGDDQLFGGAGNDSLDGGLDSDTMTGGTGDDIYFVYDFGDVIVELADEGTDEVRTSLSSFTLDETLENLTGLSPLAQSLFGNGGTNVIRGLTAGDTLDGLGGDDFLFGNGGIDTLRGGSGNDELDGGAGADSLRGGTGNDIYWADGSDSIVELSGQGTDEVRTAVAAYSLAATEFVENLTGLAATGQALTGNGGSNLLRGAAGNDTLDGGAGTDTMRGGLGNDIYVVDNAGDLVEENGGEGSDEVRTGLATWVLGPEVEILTATSNVNHDFRGNSGNNMIAGGTGHDFLRLQDGGDDQAIGDAGNDVVLFGAALTSADSFDGGAGTDQIAIQGDYWGANALTLGTGVVRVENIAILPGNDTRFGDPGTNFYDYDLTMIDASVASGVTMIVDANRLRAGEDFTFDGSAEMDGGFFIYGAGGTDLLTGGARNDVFLFGAQGQWGADDVIVGGGGIDQLGLRGNYTIAFGADQLIGIEAIGLVSALDTRFGALGVSYSYDLTMHDANVAAGVRMIVDAAPVRGAETLTFDGSAESDGSFRLFGGAGNDRIIGSRNDDLLFGRAGDDRIEGGLGADTIAGDAGADIFVYGATAESTAARRDTLNGFAPGSDRIDLAAIDADSLAGGDQAFSWIGANAFAGTGAASAGQLRASQVSGGWLVEGDTNGDGTADLVILVNSGAQPLTQADFIF